MTEPPQETTPCDECGQDIPDDAPDMINTHHAPSCTLYPFTGTITIRLTGRWRTGRKVGRTIYIQRGPQPSDDDPLIGVMDTPSLARAAVSSHNWIFDHRRPPAEPEPWPGA